MALFSIEYETFQGRQPNPRRFELPVLLSLIPIPCLFPKRIKEICMTTTTFNPFLELSLAQTNSQGAYLYRLDGEALQLAAWSGRAASDTGNVAVSLPLEIRNALLLERSAWSDWRLEGFPEFLHNRFEAAAAIPLVDAGEVVGVLHVCRVTPAPYQAREAAFLFSLGLPLGSL